jgi:predicted Fe-Mo cluster-binding NifX family protein
MRGALRVQTAKDDRLLPLHATSSQRECATGAAASQTPLKGIIMRIAVASSDGVSISEHFGRSRCFIVFEGAGGKIVGREVRDNTCTPHAKGQCQGGHEDHHDHPHSHADIVNALRDCEVVLCYGMGWRVAEELKANGIRPFIIPGASTPEEAAHAFLNGTLGEGGTFCRCHH